MPWQVEKPFNIIHCPKIYLDLVRIANDCGFGYRSDPFTGRRAFHRGIDIVAPAGKEVYATGDGIVDWFAVLAAGQATGVMQCHVEQDQSPDPVASIGQSIRHLKSLP